MFNILKGKYFLFLLLLGIGLFLIVFESHNPRAKDDKIFKEIQKFKETQATFPEISDFFKKLTETEGAEYALLALARAPLPGNIDLHLLGHTVGDELYKQEGVSGIAVCTNDFRNACSHSIVVGALLERGEDALRDIADICRKAPGGKGAYTMCFHGLGHGILAYTNYELKNAIPLCKKTGTQEYNNREYFECVGGTIMEMIGGGGHDKALWGKKSKEYLKTNDPLYPCTAKFMPREALPICYLYITPHLFTVAGGDIGFPKPRDFEKAFPFCNVIPKTEEVSRNACFGGFGKEFVVLANDRDIRTVDKMEAFQLKTVYEWCLLAKYEDGMASCLDSSVKSLFWGGENDRSAGIRFCNSIDNVLHQKSCFESLFNEVDRYIDDDTYKKEFCREVSKTYQIVCRQKLSIVEK